MEIVVPELHEMRTAHIVAIGSEAASGLNPDFEDGFVPNLFAYGMSLCFPLKLEYYFCA